MKSSPISALAAALLALAWSGQAGAQHVMAPASPAPAARLGPAFGVAGLPGLAGRGGNTNPGWSQGNGVRLGLGSRPGRGHGHGAGPGRGGNRNYGYGGLGLYGGYGGGVIEDPESFRDQGYFAGPAEVWAENGQAAYAYDRAYPYDWYRESSARTSRVRSEPRMEAPAYRCSVERAGVRVCRGGG